MAKKSSRYKQMERYMTCALCTDTIIFILYLLLAGQGIIWLKIIMALFCILLSLAILGFLFISQELLKPRSLWLSVSAVAILVCLICSLLLNFPSPNEYKPDDNDSAYHNIERI
ncbi:MAG: hypothetical protein IIU86_03755 [Oscillospiraceae bacterium]|nr:hypothetical protein [Oscillospiraceae bacterium]